MQSKATTVEAYLAELPEDRRAALEAVRKVIKKNLDKKFAEGMQYGMIGYFVPHSVYPAGYHCDPRQPLPFAGLASQKNHMSLYLMSCYTNCHEESPSDDESRWFRDAWISSGKKLDMGKCCIRFKKLDDLALDVIAEAIKRVTVKSFIEHYESAILTSNKAAAAKRATAKPAQTTSPARKPTPKKATPKPKESARKASAKKATPKKSPAKTPAAKRSTKRA